MEDDERDEAEPGTSLIDRDDLLKSRGQRESGGRTVQSDIGRSGRNDAKSEGPDDGDSL